MNYNGLSLTMCIYMLKLIMLPETDGVDYYLHLDTFINNLESVCTCFVLLVGNIKSLTYTLATLHPQNAIVAILDL